MKKTPLYERHLALGAKVIDFGGWAMPVQYTNVIEEHRTTRRNAGIFDICHMGEIEIQGEDAFSLLQHVMSRNLEKQSAGQMKLSLLLNEKGGIIDDLTVYKTAENNYMVVTNAVTKDRDLAWITKVREEKGYARVNLRDITDITGKIDLQGPLAASILEQITADDPGSLGFYSFSRTRVLGNPAIVSRSGYTGEDGFEIYVPADKVGEVWDALLEQGRGRGLKPVGLGARDTLRLEAGMMLYGNEMNENVTPFEVVYGWITDLDKEFIGRDCLLRQKEKGLERKLVGFEMEDRGIARHGYSVTGNDGKKIGEVTSGTFSPTLNRPIGLAFVPFSFREPGTEIRIDIRGNQARARVAKLPFYKRDRH
ncbi:MAG: glycine cleavage system aminomethyltransferase GcvT [Syntrophales bacterium]|nr:glycine cleavage system aminomethyltransferase GcvT [Syntrophales bacterium]MDD5232603.1 glycine cleavage system aminomethyltransferase GcvT [Syntrophales bacterium]MDD5533064.1 glycine cleavage system aminomethyltransferase GcvT [Syntrophales bacterium]